MKGSVEQFVPGSNPTTLWVVETTHQPAVGILDIVGTSSDQTLLPVL